MNRRELFTVAAALPLAGAATAAEPRTYKRIACEEAWITPAILAESRKLAKAAGRMTFENGMTEGPYIPLLLDLGESRLAGMDAAGIDIQLLLLTSPGIQHLDDQTAVALAAASNDALAQAVRAHPQRFAGLAAVAPQDPKAAVRELERSVRTLGLKGAVINSHTRGAYLDEARFWPILEAAEALDVPIYIHPRDPAPALDGAEIPGITVGWGFSVETGTHALRLILAGVFDRFPRLRIVLGHLGETIPFMLERIDNRYRFEQRLFSLPKLKQAPGDYFRQNFFITSSGMNVEGPMTAAIKAMGPDRVLFAADYPFEDQAAAVRDAEAVPMTPAARAAFFEGNARRVFRL